MIRFSLNLICLTNPNVVYDWLLVEFIKTKKPFMRMAFVSNFLYFLVNNFFDNFKSFKRSYFYN